MKLSAPLLFTAATTAHAHYTFPQLIVNGRPTGEWNHVRKTVSWQNNGFVSDVRSLNIRCNQLNPNSGAPATASVAAGSRVGFVVAPSIYHPGPLAFYMAKVPAGKTAATYDGSGAEWFKISHEQPSFGSQLTWKSNGISRAETTIPRCIPSGDYLLRVEHLGLHSASSPGGGQFYISCAQITVTGGGNANPGPKVALPGAYSPNDPGIAINIYYPIPTSYRNPGPSVFTC